MEALIEPGTGVRLSAATPALLETNFSEAGILVPVVSFGRSRGTAVLDSFLANVHSSFKACSPASVLVVYPRPVLLEGRALLMLEVANEDRAIELAGLLLGSVAVVNLDGVNGMTQAERVLRTWQVLAALSPIEKVRNRKRGR